MVDATLLLGLVGGVGAVISVLVAVLPQALDWYYERVNRPLTVKVVSVITRVNQTQYGLVRFRVRNRIRAAISVQVSPMCIGYLPELVQTEGIFADPRVLTYPSNETAFSFWLPGHDTREVALELPVRPNVFEGRETVSPIVFASRFVVQEVPLGPFEFSVTSG